jgi:hypothetical protein
MTPNTKAKPEAVNAKTAAVTAPSSVASIK